MKVEILTSRPFIANPKTEVIFGKWVLDLKMTHVGPSFSKNQRLVGVHG